MAAFSELSFAAHWLGRLSKGSTTSNSTIKLLTTAAMVDNLAEKVDTGTALYGVAAIQGLLKY